MSRGHYLKPSFVSDLRYIHNVDPSSYQKDRVDQWKSFVDLVLRRRYDNIFRVQSNCLFVQLSWSNRNWILIFADEFEGNGNLRGGWPGVIKLGGLELPPLWTTLDDEEISVVLGSATCPRLPATGNRLLQRIPQALHMRIRPVFAFQLVNVNCELLQGSETYDSLHSAIV